MAISLGILTQHFQTNPYVITINQSGAVHAAPPRSPWGSCFARGNHRHPWPQLVKIIPWIIGVDMDSWFWKIMLGYVGVKIILMYIIIMIYHVYLKTTLWIICSGDDGLLLQQVMFGRSKSWPQSANGPRSAAFPIAYSRPPLRIVLLVLLSFGAWSRSVTHWVEAWIQCYGPGQDEVRGIGCTFSLPGEWSHLKIVGLKIHPLHLLTWIN